MGLPGGVGPLEGEGRPQLIGQPQGAHRILIQRDFIGLFRQPPLGGQREDRLGVVPVGDRQLDRPLAEHRVGEGADGAEGDGGFDVDMLAEEGGLGLSEAGVEDVAGGAVEVLVAEQKPRLHGVAQQEDEGIQGGDQRRREDQEGVFGPVEPEVPADKGPGDLKVVVIQHRRASSDDLPVFNPDDPPGHLGDFQVVGDHDEGLPVGFGRQL